MKEVLPTFVPDTLYMKKRILQFILVIVLLLLIGLIYLFTYTPSLSEKQGMVETKLYVGDSLNQPLVVAFGGGGGGNDWARDYMKDKREGFLKRGYAVLAIGYFNSGDHTPDYLDRISLNAISDTIMAIASRNTIIDKTKIALIGGSKGGELILNLAARYDHFGAVVPMSTAHVSFPGLTITANTSSWSYNGEEVTYVPAPFKTIGPAIKGDHFAAFSMMLEDDEAVKNAEIEVEKINGPILILSASEDEAWPSSEMSNRIMERLDRNAFSHYHKHIVFEGGHIEPLNHFDIVYDFLDKHLKNK